MPIPPWIIGAFCLISFMGSWNSFLWPQIILHHDSRFTLPIGLNQMVSLYTQEYDTLMAGTLLAVLPVILLFLALQREFVAGLTAGAVKVKSGFAAPDQDVPDNSLAPRGQHVGDADLATRHGQRRHSILFPEDGQAPVARASGVPAHFQSPLPQVQNPVLGNASACVCGTLVTPVEPQGGI